MGGRERLRHAMAEGRDLLRRELAAVEPGREVLSIEPFHREERPSFRGRAVGGEAHDGRVVQRGEGLGFEPEPPRELLALVAQELQRHDLPGTAIERAVDGSHAARGDELLNDEAVRSFYFHRYRLRTYQAPTLTIVAVRGATPAPARRCFAGRSPASFAQAAPREDFRKSSGGGGEPDAALM